MLISCETVGEGDVREKRQQVPVSSRNPNVATKQLPMYQIPAGDCSCCLQCYFTSFLRIVW